ncbi:MAG: ABC transporter substrate-binding protein, partial [Acidimicrobiales bacterium]
MSRRGVLQLSAVGAGALALSPKLDDLREASTLRPRASAHASSPKSGGTLTFGRNTGPTQLDPANSIVEGDVYTLDKIFEPLYITSPAGDLTPWLAESHSVSADGKTWTFKLRPGVEFSDGKALTADDVVFSINRARKDANGPLSFLDSAIKTITATNASTVTFELTQVWAPFLSDISVFANAILPNNFGGKSEAAFFAKPVGTGPFLLESFVKGGNVTLKKNPKYWQKGKPYLDEVNFTYVSSDNQR